ncbi:MAG: 3-deoxy-D-manno-octulosonate 8-phosphate phosphatase [Chlamydiales bacterium]|jgi:YrbI family 3-deoxy-D-manno-octulosonate 8-phosphate phosphatase|nr:3-deoxy-D-manno-octulosonate 8-phosphate phosphatase [Chlamydiales bacterium]
MTFQEKLKKIKLVVLDIDGTLTDGGMYYTAEGDVMKRFHVRDGMGIALLKLSKIEVALMTSEEMPLLLKRAEKLRLEHIFLGCRNKAKTLQKLASDLNLSLDEIAFMGDDVNDEGAMALSGLKVCPNDAADRILNLADYRCQRPAGRGAVREFADLLLTAQGLSTTLPDQW